VHCPKSKYFNLGTGIHNVHIQKIYCYLTALNNFPVVHTVAYMTKWLFLLLAILAIVASRQCISSFLAESVSAMKYQHLCEHLWLIIQPHFVGCNNWSTFSLPI